MAVRDAMTGRVLGEFVLRERIGEGGFGAVYRCEQPLLGREAVIKVLHARLRGSDIAVQRFMREAQLASRLDHPYAAHVYAFGVERDDGLCWIAMELVQGTTLDRWLRDRGSLPLAQLVPFFERVAEVVHTAHEGGIVHRDLKPQNIMVIERAGRLLPKLLDFGIAKAFGDNRRASLPPPTAGGTTPSPSPSASGDAHTMPELSASELDRPAKPSEIDTLPAADATQRDATEPLTKADAAIGSPPYMAPEQWLDATNVGPSADLYALGIVLYEALVGRRPFTADTVAGYASMHVDEPVPSVGDGHPIALDRFFQRALAKQAADRPATALELAASLRVAAGLATAPEDLPRLDETVRDAWLADAPQHLAEGVALLDAARNVHQARDAARDLYRSLVRYLAAIALAARAQVRSERDDAATRELLRAVRLRELDDDERVKLVRSLVRPFASRRGAHPMPDLVDVVTPSGDGHDAFDELLQLQRSSDLGGVEDVVRSHLVQLVPALARLLRAVAFVLDHPLVIPRDRVAELWMGMRRQRRTSMVVRESLADGEAVLLDRDGKRALVLAPLVQTQAPTVGTDPELFVFEGARGSSAYNGGRLGARLAAAPAGYEHHDPAVWDWFADNVLGEIDGATTQRDDDAPPYLGLASFSTGDADRFVGREREIDALVNRLRRQPLQIVVGPSGAGKSSFVHAGVVPALPAGWRTVTLRPGVAPFATLTARLASGTSPNGGGTLVVVVDQLEELFTLCSNAGEREQFAATLAQLAASPDGATRVICTVRDDFLMHVESLAPLRPSLSAALFLIGNPSRDDLVRTIVEPARSCGYELSDAELAGDMVDVVADRPGALALLSFTASRLWELRDRRFRQLTRRAYDSMGGVAGALGQHAETTFEGLVADEQRVAREAFRLLVTTDRTRAVLVLDELYQRLASPKAERVIAKLVDARLLAIVEGETATHIEIIHEALIAAWPRLQRWTQEESADARSREQIAAAAKQWHERSRPRDLLWRGDLLAELERVRARSPLTDSEAAFADASRADALRGRRIRRALVAFAVLATAVFIAVLTRANAKAQKAQASAEDLLRDSTFDQGRLRMLQGDKLGALPFLAKAYRMGETGAANRLLIEEALRTTRARVATLSGHTDKLWQVAYSPDGKLLATASNDGTARIWDADTGILIDKVELDGAVDAVAFDPSGTLLAVGGRDANVRVWDVPGHRQLVALAVTSNVEQVVFSPDGKQLLASGQGLLRVWSLADRAVHDLSLATSHRFDLISAAFSADGSRLATWTDTGEVVVVEAHTFSELQTHRAPGTINCGAIARDGSVVALGLVDGGLDLLPRAGPAVEKPHAHGKEVNAIAISSDGALIASASGDGNARVWTATGDERATLHGHTAAIMTIAFSPENDLLATGSSDATARLWTTATGTPRGELVGHTNRVQAIAFRRDGARLATASWDHRVFVWDVDAAQQFRPLPSARVDTSRRLSFIHYGPDGTTVALIDPDGALIVRACRIRETKPIDAFAWSPDGTLIATMTSADPVRVVDVRTCGTVAELGEPRAASSLAFTSTGMLVVGEVGEIRVYDVTTRHIDATFTGFTGNVIDVSVAGDHLIAITFAPESQRWTVEIQELSGSKARRVFAAGLSSLSQAVYDHDRHRVLAASYDQHLWIWDDRTQQLIAKLEGTGPLWGVHATETRFIGVGGNTPVVWDSTSLQQTGSLVGHLDLVLSAGMLGNALLITASLDGTARVWDISTLRPLLVLQGAVTVDLDARGSRAVLSDPHGVREWVPSLPVPDFAHIDRLIQ